MSKDSEKIIFLIRHAEKDAGFFYNKELHAQDPPLSKAGIKQAKLLRKRLKKYNIQEIWTSNLLRTLQTSQIVNKYLKIPIFYYPELREINMGVYEK